MPPDKVVEPKLLRGFRDYLPGSMNARNAIISTIRTVYERYGFMPLETPAQEYRVTLLGYGEENSKQIFPVVNPEEEDVALRFDLTAPLARVVAQYPDLPLPFRRYQVGPVWRADKPDPGRFREFLQFDLDTVGSASLAADLEILCGMHDTLEALGFSRFKIRFSDRKLLNSLLDFAGISHDTGHKVFRVLDKLEKIGFENVAAELTAGRVDASGDRIPGLGLAAGQVERIHRFITIPQGPRAQVLSRLESLFSQTPSAREALDELKLLCDGLGELDISDDRVALDQSIARGLDYYTGPVFEAILLDAPEFGSVFGGGRYDGLVERFLGRKIPGVGASIGVDRLFAAMQKLNMIDVAPATAQVIVTTMEPSRLIEYASMTRELRQAGIRTEMYLGDEKGLGKQLQYANRLKIPFAVIMGSDEFSRDEVTIKNLVLGGKLQDTKKTATGKDRDEWLKLSRTVQQTIPRQNLLETLHALLAQEHNGNRT